MFQIVPQREPNNIVARAGATLLYEQWKAAQGPGPASNFTLKVLILSDAKLEVGEGGILVAFVSAMSYMEGPPDDPITQSWTDNCATNKIVRFLVGGDQGGYGCVGNYIIINGRSQTNCKESVARMRRDSHPVVASLLEHARADGVKVAILLGSAHVAASIRPIIGRLRTVRDNISVSTLRFHPCLWANPRGNDQLLLKELARTLLMGDGGTNEIDGGGDFYVEFERLIAGLWDEENDERKFLGTSRGDARIGVVPAFGAPLGWSYENAPDGPNGERGFYTVLDKIDPPLMKLDGIRLDEAEVEENREEHSKEFCHVRKLVPKDGQSFSSRAKEHHENTIEGKVEKHRQVLLAALPQDCSQEDLEAVEVKLKEKQEQEWQNRSEGWIGAKVVKKKAEIAATREKAEEAKDDDKRKRLHGLVDKLKKELKELEEKQEHQRQNRSEGRIGAKVAKKKAEIAATREKAEEAKDDDERKRLHGLVEKLKKELKELEEKQEHQRQNRSEGRINITDSDGFKPDNTAPKSKEMIEKMTNTWRKRLATGLGDKVDRIPKDIITNVPKISFDDPLSEELLGHFKVVMASLIHRSLGPDLGVTIWYMNKKSRTTSILTTKEAKHFREYLHRLQAGDRPFGEKGLWIKHHEDVTFINNVGDLEKELVKIETMSPDDRAKLRGNATKKHAGGTNTRGRSKRNRVG
ncbi:hypothetical protein TrRE_jg8770 [Triparma retinervis]|uniref:Uncharacterized protein n=1 Tax=Triparma retinervis TaxID=2557542 RepID=A0A9W6ZYY5_9STRA|nr:hypothetical protein TrRE_jg8770 [Triparma retinervis]